MSDPEPTPEEALEATPTHTPAPAEERLYHESELPGGSFESVGGGMYRKIAVAP